SVVAPVNRTELWSGVRYTHQCCPPPNRFANHRRQAALAGITKLRENAPASNSDCKRERTSQYGAPQFVARVMMVNPDFIASFSRVVMTNRDQGREKDIVTRRYTLQSVIRLFIRVNEP